MSIPFIDIHTHQRSASENVLAVRNYFLQELDSTRNFPFTAGIHPWHAADFPSEEVSRMLENLSSDPDCVAIGETGLDKRSKVEFNKQKEIFELHLDYAQKQAYPLIIHNVHALNELMEYSKNSRVPFVLHGYHGKIEMTRQLLRHNCYFSFGESLLINPSLAELIQQIPLDHLFLETDESKIAIMDIYAFAASRLGMSSEELRKKIFINFNRVFKIR